MKRYKIKPITYFLFFILVVGIIGCVAYFGLVKGNGKSEKDESVTTEKKDSWHDSLSKKRDKK